MVKQPNSSISLSTLRRYLPVGKPFTRVGPSGRASLVAERLWKLANYEVAGTRIH
jgi:hypothetical protein